MKTTIAGAMTVLLVALAGAGGPSSAQEKTSTESQAFEKLKEADALNQKDKIEEAAAAYREAARLYEKALASKPDDKVFLQNHKYCLGRPGYIRILKAQRLAKEGRMREAADLYDAAVAEYGEALAAYPQEKNFLQNSEFARQNGAVARFQVLLQTNGPAPDFALPSLHGGRVGLADFRDKVVLVEFMAGWCPGCQASLPVLQSVKDHFSGRPVEIVLLALDRVKPWQKSGSDKKSVEATKSLTLKAVWAEEDTYLRFGAFPSIPSVFLIDRKGFLVAQIPYEEQKKDEFIARIEAALRR